MTFVIFIITKILPRKFDFHGNVISWYQIKTKKKWQQKKL